MDERREMLERRAAGEAARREVETARARELVAEFAARARERGLTPTRLTARGYNGRTSYRTNVHGWYVRADRSMAVGTDGGFYVLAVPDSLRARLTGATVTPQDPRPIVGEGARDGQSMPLEALLRKRLEAGDDWP